MMSSHHAAGRTGMGYSGTKIDYYLYNTRARGFSEWLLDPDDEEVSGAAAFVASGTYHPTNINTAWRFWKAKWNAWTSVELTITCEDGVSFSGASRAAPHAHHLASWGATLVCSLLLWRTWHGRRNM